MEYYSPIQYKLLNALLERDKNRAELIVEIEKKRTTVYDNLVVLSRRKNVEKYSKNDGIQGRPFVYWRLTNLGREKIKNMRAIYEKEITY